MAESKAGHLGEGLRQLGFWGLARHQHAALCPRTVELNTVSSVGDAVAEDILCGVEVLECREDWARAFADFHNGKEHASRGGFESQRGHHWPSLVQSTRAYSRPLLRTRRIGC